MTTSRSNTIKVPAESLDKIGGVIYYKSDALTKRRLVNLSRMLALQGTIVVKNNKGEDIEVYEMPIKWFNWLKNLYEIPI